AKPTKENRRYRFGYSASLPLCYLALAREKRKAAGGSIPGLVDGITPVIGHQRGQRLPGDRLADEMHRAIREQEIATFRVAAVDVADTAARAVVAIHGARPRPIGPIKKGPRGVDDIIRGSPSADAILDTVGVTACANPACVRPTRSFDDQDRIRCTV